MMMTDFELQLALQNINLLIENAHLSATQFAIKDEKISKNIFFRSEQLKDLNTYLQKLINALAKQTEDHPLYHSLFVSLQYFFNLKPNNLINELNLDFSDCSYLKSKKLTIKKLNHLHQDNPFKEQIHQKNLPEIQYNSKTGHYTAPDDDKAHHHGEEAKRIFISTQLERFKSLLNFLFAKIGIHIFESARYQERDYLETDIYNHHTAIQYPQNAATRAATHYWIGHSSNFITIPTEDSSLHVLTDPVEGDLAPLLYPRMTKEGKLIEGENEQRLPKVDVVIISHNHRDHVSEPTLKRLVKQQPRMIVPEGDEALFLGLGFNNVVGLKWWEQAVIHDDNKELLRVTAVPAKHWSGRGIGDAHCSAFNGYVLNNVYFAGDTALMDDEISQKIFDHFDIVTSIQPGGPDEGRADMESTHQSSADAILMHFKILATKYKKLAQENAPLSLGEFLKETANLKTIYNHTATFKLGNLRLKDSFYSWQRIIAVFQNNQPIEHLPAHEQAVVEGIRTIAKTMTFEEGTFSDAMIVAEISNGIVIPKIGQRQPLYVHDKRPSPHRFSARNLITNGRALNEFDAFLENYIKTSHDFLLTEFTYQLLATYPQPWHAFFSRTFKNISPFMEEIKNCSNSQDLLDVLNRLDNSMGSRNQHGHMQSLIHYVKWIIELSSTGETKEKLKEYFVCQQIRKLVDTESRTKIGFNRKEKQHAFQLLADQLVDLPEQLSTYQNTIETWLGEKKITIDQSTEGLLKSNRSHMFARQKTHSMEIVEQIKALAKP